MIYQFGIINQDCERKYMTKYRAGIIGLGYMGMLYDIGTRTGIWDGNDPTHIDRPLPDNLDIHRRVHMHEYGLREEQTYAAALNDRPEIQLVAGADRDIKRLEIFQKRYNVNGLYTDAIDMLKKENLDVVAIASNVKGRADLTCAAVDNGAKGILTEKPMVHTIEETDRMVKSCAEAGVPIVCGSTATSHPAFGEAKELIKNGEIGELLSIEAGSPAGQDQSWSYFIDGEPSWVVGMCDTERRQDGSDEFEGQGMLGCSDGVIVHFRKGAPRIRVTGTEGEFMQQVKTHPLRLFKNFDYKKAPSHVEIPWTDLNVDRGGAGTVFGLSDLIECMEGRLDEPKNSARRVAVAINVEIALKESSDIGGKRVDLPLQDRTLGLNYASHR